MFFFNTGPGNIIDIMHLINMSVEWGTCWMIFSCLVAHCYITLFHNDLNLTTEDLIADGVEWFK